MLAPNSEPSVFGSILLITSLPLFAHRLESTSFIKARLATQRITTRAFQVIRKYHAKLVAQFEILIAKRAKEGFASKTTPVAA